MGIHHLVTGLNGAGKTLYAVSQLLAPVAKAHIEYRGQKVKRRIVQGGIKDLLIPHELMAVPELEVEGFVDEWHSHKREPGTPPVEGIEYSILNWWLWCQPGDYIVVDECQRVFRPMPSGRRIPMFINKLETARHYGVEFLYLTQHPQLLHMNVRKLVGPHEDVQRVFGSGRVIIYQWPRANDVGSVGKATSRIWKHDKKAFALYKSAEIHGSFKQRWPLAVWGLLLGLVAVGWAGWRLYERWQERFESPATTATAGQVIAPGGAPGGSPGGLPGAPGAGAAGARPGGYMDRFPAYALDALPEGGDPYDLRGFQLEGQWTIGHQVYAVFGLVVAGQRVATVSLVELGRAGYSFTSFGPCSGLLRYGSRVRPVTCPPPAADRGEGRPAAETAPAQPPALSVSLPL